MVQNTSHSGKVGEPPPTGHPVVDAIGRLEHKFIGALAPYAWFSKILDERGRPYHLAILLLAEIVGWYRPRIELAKGSNTWVVRKRFKRDRLQISRGDLAEKFNTDEDTITTALNVLAGSVGAIKRSYHDLVIGGRKHRNCLFVWPVPEVIEKLCEVDQPEDESDPTKPSGVAPMMGATWPTSQGPHTPDDGGDVAMSKGPRGPVDPGDVDPVMGVGTVTGRESNRKSTTTKSNGSTHGAAAPVVVVAESSFQAANPADSPANAPAAQKGKRPSKQAAQASSPATGAPRRTAGEKPASDTAEAADASGREAGAAGDQSDPVGIKATRFLDFFQIAHKSKFGTSARPTETDRQAVRNLIRQDNWAVPDLVLILLRAWDLIGAISEDNGYAYPCCQHSQKIGKFVQHFDRICSDTGSNNIRDLPVGKVIAKIMRLTEVDPDEIERFFAPELEQELAADPEPEMRLEDMPDPGQTGVGLKVYVRTTPNIPFEWIEQKLIPHLAERYEQLPAGKLEFLFGYWKLCKRYRHHFSHDIECDYREARNHRSGRFKDEGVRAKLLTIVEAMFKQYRRWEQTGTGERPLWPILSNVLSDERIRKLLQDGEPQVSARREAD